MGKKSIGLPFGYEDDDKMIYSSAPEEVKQLEGYLQWSEFVKNLIRLLDANDSRNAQLLREEILFNRKKQWEAADTTTKNNNLKEVGAEFKVWLHWCSVYILNQIVFCIADTYATF